MTHASSQKDGLADGMPRDERGYWQPDKEIGAPNPMFAWPPRPKAVLKWFVSYLWPWNLFYMIVATVTWLYLTPQLSRAVEFRAGWILEVYARNLVLMTVFASALHIYFWSKQVAGIPLQVHTGLDGEGQARISLE